MADIEVIAFDADDTLWHNESLYVDAKGKLGDVLAPYVSFEVLDRELDQTEARNILSYGYGITSFTLSMVEIAITVSGGKIPVEDIYKIISFGKGMLEAEVVLLDYVQEAISQLAKLFTLMIITKGHLLDQEKKLARSGIESYFDCIEIVSEKNQHTYQRILSKYKIQPQQLLMVGNSLKSDIFPVIQLGGRAVHIPAEVHWSLDVAPDAQLQVEDYYEIEHMGQLLRLIETMGGG